MKFLLLVVLLFGFETVLANEKLSNDPPIVTYGELLLKEEANDKINNFISVQGGFESGNPLLDVYNFSGSYSYQFFNYFEVGFLARTFSAKKTALLTSVEQNFAILGVDINSEVPKNSYYLTVGVLPLKGRLNFFGLTTLAYHWMVILGVGERQTEISKYSGYMWAIESKVFITKQWAIILNFNQEAEAAFNSRQTVSRNQVNIGLALGF